MLSAYRYLWVCLLLAGSALPASADDLLVFAAASLTEALDEVSAQFQQEQGIGVKASYASSSTLARQIEQGAPADVFISANAEWLDYLQERAMIVPATRHALLGNELVLVAPADSTVELTIAPGFALAEALGTGRLAMGDPDHVPAGIYAKAALVALGVWPAVSERVARADNVRAALALVARGEVPLAIVYRSDAIAADVRVVGTFPADSHPPIVYPAAVIAGSIQPAAAALLAYLRSPAAAAVFERHGFSVLP